MHILWRVVVSLKTNCKRDKLIGHKIKNYIELKVSSKAMMYLDGRFLSENEAKIKCNDRGFLLGDGIFETIRSYEGKISCMAEHYQRLKKSADILEMPFMLQLTEFEEILRNLLSENKLNEQDASIRITLTRGVGPRGVLPPVEVNSTVLVSVFPYMSGNKELIKVLTSEIRRNETSPLSNIKSLCYLENIIARQNAKKNGADECIFLNTQGNVACVSVANIFIVNDNGIVTPRIEDGVLPGITRRLVIEICQKNNIPIKESQITKLDLMKAKEVFITNRLIEIQAIAEIDGYQVANGKVGSTTWMLKKLYKDYIPFI